MTLAGNQHDKLARAVFQIPTWAAALLRGFLGEELLGCLDLKSFELRAGSFVDEELCGHETDLLFRIQTKAGPGHLFLLFEHQSTPVYLMPVRLMRYVARIHDHLWQENGALQEIPLVLPVVFYHGQPPWKGPTRLSQLYAGSPQLKQAFGLRPAELEFALIDLSQFSDADLKARATKGASMAMLTALLLKHYKSRDMDRELAGWRDLISRVACEPNGLRALELFICYALEATTATEKELVEILVPIIQAEVKTMIKTTGQKLREEGRAEGLAEGLAKGQAKAVAKGRAEALREAICRILTARFGKLLPAQQREIDRAAEASLDALFERALQAESIQEVLGR